MCFSFLSFYQHYCVHSFVKVVVSLTYIEIDFNVQALAGSKIVFEKRPELFSLLNTASTSDK